MASRMIIRMRSGKEHTVEMGSDMEHKTPDDCCDAFFDATKLSSWDTIKMGPFILYTREIESFTFE